MLECLRKMGLMIDVKAYAFNYKPLLKSENGFIISKPELTLYFGFEYSDSAESVLRKNGKFESKQPQ